MAILLDYSGTAIAGIMAQHSVHQKLDDDLIRHFILNSIRAARSKFTRQYGDMIICCDGRKSWRKSYYPYYKARRQASREDATLDWKQLFISMDKIRTELIENFPYPVVQFDAAEGDDVIAVLAKKLPGPHIVVSNDKDMVQVQQYDARIWAPVKQTLIPKVDNIAAHVKEHIIRGDRRDGIPNVLSDDDTFVNPEKRQGQLRQKKLDELMETTPALYAEELLRNYIRNETLIDLNKVPTEVKDGIIATYEQAKTNTPKNRSLLMNYFIKNRLANLFDKIGEF
jgi:hypothetical protein